MNEKSDVRLLCDYVERGSDAAFGCLVSRYTNFVYSAALRQVGSPDVAADISQCVFVDLARKAATVAAGLGTDSTLAGWLHRSTRYAALNHLRAARRRAANERQAMEQLLTNNDPAPDWEQVRPILDEALDSLHSTDREALLLRYFQQRDFRTVGRALGMSDDAAQKRVSRALDHLRTYFSKRGVAAGAGGLAALLATHTVQAAPAGLAAAISSAATAAGVATSSLTTIATIKAITMTTLQKALVTTTLIASIGATIYQTSRVSGLDGQVRVLQSKLESASAGDNSRPGNLRTTAPGAARAPHAALTRARLKAGIEDLAKQGIGAFGRANMNQLIAGASVEDIPGLLALVDEQLPDDLRRHFHEAWIERWAAADAPATFAYVNTLKDATEKKSALESVFANWVDQDLAAATKAVEQLKGNAKEDSANALIAAWMMKEPAAALNWAVDNNQDQIRPAIRLAETRPDDVWKWANSVTNPWDRQHYLELLADSLARSMPDKMGAFVASLEPGDNQSYLAAEVAGSWAATDPAAAAQWAMEFPDERYRTRAVGYIAKAWSTTDPAAAATWIQSLPAGPSRDTAGMEYVEQLSDKSPDQAAGMIQSMNDSPMRETVITNLARRWMETDPTAATKWLKTIGKNPDEVSGKTP